MFPNDAITYFEEISGVVTSYVTPLMDDSTILAVAMQQENVSSDTTVRCGSDEVAKNYATNFSMVAMSYECQNGINIHKTGNDNAGIIITYVPYLMSEVPGEYNPPTDISSSTDVSIYGSISAGEVLIVLFLFIIIVMELIKLQLKALSKIQTGKKFLAYSGGDVEIRKDL